VREIEFAREATVCKYLVPKGYPEAPEAGVEFTLPLRELAAAGVEVYFASVEEVDGRYRTTASRSAALLARAGTPHEAKRILDDILKAHCPPPLYYRRDIPRLPGD